MLNDVKKVIDGKCLVDVIDMRDYGTLRGDKILAKALKMAAVNCNNKLNKILN